MSLFEIVFMAMLYILLILFVLGLIAYVLEGYEIVRRWIKTGSTKPVDEQFYEKMIKDQNEFMEWLSQRGFK